MGDIKYPVYVISKGRFDLKAHTMRFLLKDGVDAKVVVEPQELSQYEKRFGSDRCLVLPFSNLGQGSIPARNWCWDHSIIQGRSAHWLFDDNISGFVKIKGNKRVKINSKKALYDCEKFFNKFSNLAICGVNYSSLVGFAIKNGSLPPYYTNTRCYSGMIIRNDLNFRWRGRYNEDTDLCLQALTSGFCTVNINAYLINKAATMTCKGGNMTELYQGNGRLKMARSLELAWAKYPGLVKTIYRYGRPQHHVNWSIFKTQLKLKEEYPNG